MKAVGWLTDTTVWQNYATREGTLYAIGSPTVELFAASYNSVQDEHDIILKTERYGYSHNTSPGWFTKDTFGGIYNTTASGIWWLASPGDFADYSMFMVFERGRLFLRKRRHHVCRYSSPYSLLSNI